MVVLLHEIPFSGYIVMAEDEKIMKFRQSKGNKSFITDDTLMKLHLHNHIISFMKFDPLVT